MGVVDGVAAGEFLGSIRVASGLAWMRRARDVYGHWSLVLLLRAGKGGDGGGHAAGEGESEGGNPWIWVQCSAALGGVRSCARVAR